MSEYGRDIWALTRNEDVDVIPSLIKSDLQIGAPNYFYNWNKSAGLYSKVGNKSYDDPLKAFYADKSLTVADYFEGIKNVYNEANWNDKLSSLINK